MINNQGRVSRPFGPGTEITRAWMSRGDVVSPDLISFALRINGSRATSLFIALSAGG